MTQSPPRLMLVAAPPVVASFVVLAIGAVSRSVWSMHGASVGAACVLAFSTRLVRRGPRQMVLAAAIVGLALIGIAAPLLQGDATTPSRWLSLGAMRLYVAPVFLPALLAACSLYVRSRGGRDFIAFGAVVATSALLAMQPDASQVIALFAGAVVCFIHGRAPVLRSVVTLFVVAASIAWSFTRPDPLEPVAYVEEVFALAFERSPIVGFAVVASALAFVAGLYRATAAGWFWLPAVASYYIALYACSVAGLTPAPLIGYGAGPLLGYGMLVAVSRWIAADERSASAVATT